MKFLLDMGIPRGSVAFLSRLGHDATHLGDLALQRMTDSDILDKALAEGRVVVTHDLDFGDLLAASHGTLPGVVSFRLRDMRSESINSYLQLVVEDHEESLRRGAILSVTEGRIRTRRLPIGPE